MKLPGVRAAVRRTARWIRSRVIDSALILGYHRIDEIEDDPYALRVSISHFAEQLAVLRQTGCPISLQQLLEGLDQGQLPRRAVVLTFDDGYAGTLQHVKPLLERFDIPATVFITTGFMGREFWWDHLAGLLGETRPKLLQSTYRKLLPLTESEREQLLSQFAQQVRRPGDAASFDHSLTPDELLELAGSDLIEIGAHSVTHPVLKSLPAAQQRWEIQASKARLEELLGRPISSFSYPNGSADHETRALVSEAGFVCACTSVNDVTWSGSDRFGLPRFWIPDWDGVRFAAWLKRWLRH